MRTVEEIIQGLKDSGKSYSKIANKVGMHKQSIYFIINNKRKNLTYDTLVKLNAFLDEQEKK